MTSTEGDPTRLRFSASISSTPDPGTLARLSKQSASPGEPSCRSGCRCESRERAQERLPTLDRLRNFDAARVSSWTHDGQSKPFLSENSSTRILRNGNGKWDGTNACGENARAVVTGLCFGSHDKTSRRWKREGSPSAQCLCDARGLVRQLRTHAHRAGTGTEPP